MISTTPRHLVLATLTTVTAIMASAFTMAAAPGLAQACYVSPEEAVGMKLQRFFATGDWTLDQVHKRYPKIARNELALLPGKTDTKVTMKWVNVDGARATAIVLVTSKVLDDRGIASPTFELFQVSLQGSSDAFPSWEPTSLARASVADLVSHQVAGKTAFFTRKLATVVSARLATR